MSNQDELIAKFIEISGGDDTVARFYLSISNWSLEEALSNFLGNSQDNEGVEPRENAANLVSGVEPPPNESSSSNAPPQSTADQWNSAQRPRFATLNDMGRRSPSSEDEGQAFYAGGSERSGQQVLGPPKRKNYREELTDMFRSAASVISAEAGPEPESSGSWGQGVRLGMTENDHSVVQPAVRETSSSERRPPVVLKLWSQGFSIDDGELRPYDDPENKEFLEIVMRGEIPQELIQRGHMVNLDVEDRRGEEYKKKTTVKTFKGSGHTLGSPAPNVQEDVPTGSVIVASTPKATSTDDEKKAKNNLNTNVNAPMTTLQIRLEDGSRLAVQFNLTHTVEDIHQYIVNARPQYAGRNFILVSSFPTRELIDKTVTIEEADLKNAALMQRLK